MHAIENLRFIVEEVVLLLIGNIVVRDGWIARLSRSLLPSRKVICCTPSALFSAPHTTGKTLWSPNSLRGRSRRHRRRQMRTIYLAQTTGRILLDRYSGAFYLWKTLHLHKRVVPNRATKQQSATAGRDQLFVTKIPWKAASSISPFMVSQPAPAKISVKFVSPPHSMHWTSAWRQCRLLETGQIGATTKKNL